MLWLLLLTGLSWSKTYETIGNAFTHVADCIALDLRTDFLASDQPAQQIQLCNDTTLMWKAILQDWGDYKAWVTKVCSLGVRLGECISAERAAEMMSRGKADTPNLFDVGRGAFRSQVSGPPWQDIKTGPADTCACLKCYVYARSST